MGIWYTTLEAVKDLLDWGESVRLGSRLERAIEAQSRAIDGGDQPSLGILGRRFYPEIATRYFPQPRRASSPIDLGHHDLLAATTVTAGGVVIESGQYYLNSETGSAPYDEIELNRDYYHGWPVGSGNLSRNISILGRWGQTEATTPGGTVAAEITDSATTLTVSDGAAVGAGSLLLVGSERLNVTAKAAVTTGQTLQAPMSASMGATTLAVSNGAVFNVGEVVLLTSERMLILDVVGNSLRVKRAIQGTVCAAHAGDTIYAYRSLTVQRGVLGTTAAAHTAASAISVHVVPDLAETLCQALVLNQFEGEAGAYRQQGSDDNQEPGRVNLAQILRDAQALYRRVEWDGA
jgi:hypothetical protein